MIREVDYPMQSTSNKFWKVSEPTYDTSEFNSYRMTESQIVEKYLRNNREDDQIQILAELNAVSPYAIVEILKRHNVYGTQPRYVGLSSNLSMLTDADKEYILKLRKKKESYKRISAATGVPIYLIKRFIASINNTPSS